MSSPASGTRKVGLAFATALAALALGAAPAAADTPPVVSISVPPGDENGSLAPEQPIPVTVTATDDIGVAAVDLFAGTRFIGRLTAPPYVFAYQPTVDELHGETLVAIATDVASFQTTVLRRVLIRSFRAEGLQARTKIFNSKRAPFRVRTSGRLLRPAALPTDEGCTSGVVVTFEWKGGTTNTRAQLNQRKCSFRTSSIFLPKKGKVKVIVGYGGDFALDGLRRTHTIRIR